MLKHKSHLISLRQVVWFVSSMIESYKMLKFIPGLVLEQNMEQVYADPCVHVM